MTVVRYRFNLLRFFKGLATILLLIVSLSTMPPSARPFTRAFQTHSSDAESWQVKALSPQVLQLALQAAKSATSRGVGSGKILGIIDFSLPSSERRFWVLDLEHHRVLFHELVAHGRGSGDNLATAFSNQPGSFQSSLGLFLTSAPYEGQHGYSLRLDGLESGINDQAMSRALVIHGAWYVSKSMIDQHQRLGRSLGCPAVSEEVAKPLIDTLKDGQLLFAYYPDAQWLSSSKFLNP
jgi:hypothetical protein